MISLLVTVLILGLICSLIYMMPIAEPFRSIAIVVFIIICIIVLLNNTNLLHL
jgi:predicted membrane channel-forming protein YqfA (hemolysin III family)